VPGVEVPKSRTRAFEMRVSLTPISSSREIHFADKSSQRWLSRLFNDIGSVSKVGFPASFFGDEGNQEHAVIQNCQN
jgi:hypothetical protein